MDRIDAYLVLNLLPDIGPIRVRRLLEHFGSPHAILSATRTELTTVEGIGRAMADRLVAWEEHIDLPEEQTRMADHGVSAITWEDDAYPEALRHIHDSPFLLYMRGQITPRDARAIGVVGSRRTTHYGTSVGRQLSFQLAQAGYTIISGLARGIDTVAHEAALSAGGRTIAVLGSGIGNVYPPENQGLADEIAKNGAVLSEFPVLYVPDRQSFPLRNRIVAGMSQGLLVIEAPVRSGSLITANQALEAGRPVFAVPGPIDRPTSEGCHRLIQSGAKLVTSSADVLEEFEYGLAPELGLVFEGDDHDESETAMTSDSRADQMDLSDVERKIHSCLGSDERTLDQILEASGLTTAEVSAGLMSLELKALAKQLPGKYFVRLG